MAGSLNPNELELKERQIQVLSKLVDALARIEMKLDTIAERLEKIDPEVALLSPMDSITHMLRSVETGVLGSLDLTCGEI